MNTWILVIVYLRPRLAAAAEMYEKKALACALDFTFDTIKTCEKVTRYSDLKRKIVNLAVICDRLREKLSKEEWELLELYIEKTYAEIAELKGMSKMQVYRMMQKIFFKAKMILYGLSFRLAKIEEDYACVELAARAYKKIERLKTKAAQTQEISDAKSHVERVSTKTSVTAPCAY